MIHYVHQYLTKHFSVFGILVVISNRVDDLKVVNSVLAESSKNEYIPLSHPLCMGYIQVITERFESYICIQIYI
jgi:hypothetical protein